VSTTEPATCPVLRAFDGLLADHPDHRVVLVERMPGWRWRIHEQVIYIRNGSAVEIMRAVAAVLAALPVVPPAPRALRLVTAKAS
jgi:hypothetical protein